MLTLIRYQACGALEPYLLVLFICLGLFAHSRIFHWYEDVTIISEGLRPWIFLVTPWSHIILRQSQCPSYDNSKIDNLYPQRMDIPLVVFGTKKNNNKNNNRIFVLFLSIIFKKWRSQFIRKRGLIKRNKNKTIKN